MDAVLIQSPHPDFDSFLAGAHNLLGRSVSEKADRSMLALTDAEKFRMCLTEFQGRDGQELNHHLTYSILLYAHQDDLLEILTICGMPAVVTETTARGVYAAVVTGNANQWRMAIQAGCRNTTNVEVMFSKIANIFSNETTLKIQ